MKLIEIKNYTEDYLYITYNFTTTCNFKCSYCWPYAHDGKYRFPNLDLICKNFSHLLKTYNKSDVRLTLSGGEPTLWPELGEFVKYIQKNHNCRITINTNGSRTLRWWKDYADCFDDIQISVHNEFVDIDHTINVLDEIYNRGTIMTGAQVLMDPSNWDRCVDNLNKLVDHKTPWLVKTMILTDPSTRKIMNYSPEQLNFLENSVKKRPPQEYIDLMLNLGKIIESDNTNAEMIFSNGDKKSYSTFEILKNNWNQFTGWSCDIGKERIGIDASGIVAGNCGERISDQVFNIHNNDFVDSFTLDKINPKVICSKEFCDCTSDLKVSKKSP